MLVLTLCTVASSLFAVMLKRTCGIFRLVTDLKICREHGVMQCMQLLCESVLVYELNSRMISVFVSIRACRKAVSVLVV